MDTKCWSNSAGQAASLEKRNRQPFGSQSFFRLRPKTSPIPSLQKCCLSAEMESSCRKEKLKPKEAAYRADKTKQKSALQELKQRQRAEIYALNKVMTELEQQQFEAFCKQMQSQSE